MKDKPIIKIIASLITIVIMGIIIFFIYDYYDKEAKKDSSEEEQNDNIINEENEEHKDSSKTYKLIDYDNNKEIVMIGKSKAVIDYQLTDGGNVVTVNDEPVSYVPNDSEIKYILTNNYILFYIKDYENIEDQPSDLLVIADNKGNVLKTYSNMSLYGNNYIISKPLIKDKVNDTITIKNNKLYLTYISLDLDYVDDDEVIQFCYEFDLNSNDMLDKETIIYKYNYSNYEK